MVEHPGRFGVHLAAFHQRHAEDASRRFAAEHQVPRDVDGVAQRQVLVDHLDALAPGVGGRGETHLATVEEDATEVGDQRARQHLAQRRLARAVVADESEHLAGAQGRD